MKKIVAATLIAGLFSSAGAFAAGGGGAVTPTAVALANGYVQMRAASSDKINLAEQFALTALGNRAGFVKNNFEATLSANVAAGVTDDAANNRFGTVAGSNKGYTVFTGSSVGGSVSQCGQQVKKGDDANLAASLVVAGTLVLANANGCGRQP